VDSPLEGDGFEPSVPHKKQPFLAAPVRSPQFAFRNKIGSFVPGTDGSNPSPSTSESSANLASSPGGSDLSTHLVNRVLLEKAKFAQEFSLPDNREGIELFRYCRGHRAQIKEYCFPPLAGR
jgi:hypothetical protein